MSFLNLNKVLAAYSTEPMKGNIERLVDFDDYHCLLAGSYSAVIKLQKQCPPLSGEYQKWVRFCDGGLLFDTVLLSTKGHDDELDLDFDTYEDMNTEEAYAEWGLPEGFFVFAMRSYGDPICFNIKESDGKVYLWNVEKGDFSDIWNSFADWMAEEIDDALDLIAEDAMDPLAIKIGGNDDE